MAQMYLSSIFKDFVHSSLVLTLSANITIFYPQSLLKVFGLLARYTQEICHQKTINTVKKQ